MSGKTVFSRTFFIVLILSILVGLPEPEKLFTFGTLLICVIFSAVVAFFVMAVYTGYTRTGQLLDIADATQETFDSKQISIDTLKQRYASGEISKKEFQDMKKTLEE